MRRAISFILVLAMVGTLAACGNTKQTENKESSNVKESTVTSESKETQTSEEVKEPVTITLYPSNANMISGELGGYVGEFLEEKGFKLEVWSFSDEKRNAILASGDLPDILYITDTVAINELANNGQIVDFDQYMDKLPNIANSETMRVANNYTREYITEGGLYAIPYDVGPGRNMTDTERRAVKLNWEVYEQIGAPEFSNLEELIDVLKQMKDAYPKAADGTETYAMHLFNNMDTNYFYAAFGIFCVMGYDHSGLGEFVEIDMVNESYDYILEDDSMYKYALWYLNQLMREGLIDPDSITTDRTTQHKRIEAGGALAGWGGVPGYEYAGYYPAYFDEVKSTYYSAQPYGTGYIVVNAKSENLDAVMDFVNLMADPDAILVLRSGPQGELWDIDEKGNAYVTEKGMNWWVKGETAVLESGETYSLLNTAWIQSANAITSYGVPAGAEYWDDVLAAKADSELNRKWQATTGYNNYLEQLKDKGGWIEDSFHNNVAKFTTPLSDDQKLVKAAAKDIIVNASWQMVYAETDEQFEQIWDDAVKQCEGLGVKDLYEWTVADYKEAAAKRDALEK